jgi:hypothetical protein
LNEAVEKLKTADVIRRGKKRLEKIIEKEDQEAAEKKKGLYVAFASDRVFMDLLSHEKIHLYINPEGMSKGFRVLGRDGRVRFEGRSPPKGLDLWKVGEDMVPPDVINGFKDWTTLSSRRKMFIVGLPPEISKQIRGRKAESGRFIIEADGSVTFSRLED